MTINTNKKSRSKEFAMLIRYSRQYNVIFYEQHKILIKRKYTLRKHIFFGVANVKSLSSDIISYFSF